MTTFINIFGGPGIGKSTTSAGVFYELKSRGINAEMVPEFAKDLVWECRAETLKNQYYVSARQFQMMIKLKDKCDVVVTDSPLMLGIIYASPDYPKEYYDIIHYFANQVMTPGFNYMPIRSSNFIQSGRVHTFEESTKIDDQILAMLRMYDMDVKCINKDEIVNKIVYDYCERNQ